MRNNPGAIASAAVRGAKVEERRAVIADYIGRRVGLSASHVRDHLAEQGIYVPLRTVSRDLTAIRATITPMTYAEIDLHLARIRQDREIRAICANCGGPC